MTITTQDKARIYATAAHAAVGQRRKYTNEPYINHPAAVVDIVLTVSHTDEMIAAAWLHDVVEDTKVTIEDIAAEFGPVVANLVSDLTDVSRPEDGNRAARKAIDRDHNAKASPQAKTIKLADLIDNTRSIVQHDPGFARVSLAEKALLLPLLSEADPQLWTRANKALQGS